MRFAAGVPKPATVAWILTRLGSKTRRGRDYVFDGPILFGAADGMEDQRGAGAPGAGRRSPGGMADFCRSLARCDFERHLLALR